MKIEIDAIEKNELGSNIDYKVIVPLSNDTQIIKTLSENEINTLLEDITNVLGYKPIMEKFNCTIKDAKEIKHKLNKDSNCRSCDLKMKECYRCCKVCESPLERDLLKALTRNNINVELQLRINKDNTISHFPDPIDSEKILTISDFYLETEKKKICIYTDGHTYHERTEYQAVRDRSIDRELQNLGYIVLRYTTSEIKQKLEDVVKNIKKTMEIFDFQEDINLDRNSEQPKIETGTCIRCGEKISYNVNRPLCDNCYQTWCQFGNIDYPETYCHKCGEIYEDITYKNPLCKKCK